MDLECVDLAHTPFPKENYFEGFRAIPHRLNKLQKNSEIKKSWQPLILILFRFAVPYYLLKYLPTLMPKENCCIVLPFWPTRI